MHKVSKIHGSSIEGELSSLKVQSEPKAMFSDNKIQSQHVQTTENIVGFE